MSAEYDAIIIGSGFGGACVAYPLLRAGWRVLMIERGEWLTRGPENWRPEAVCDLSRQYDSSTPYHVTGEQRRQAGSVHCVGGASVFYGGVSLRYREADFTPTSAERQAGACWPFSYGELEPYYAAAEQMLGVAGQSGSDPTEPFRSAPYPNRLPPLSRIGQRIADAAERSGHQPYRLPLAINYAGNAARNACIRCSTCDCYPCAVAAKNDVASALLPGLIAAGLELITGTSALRIRVNGRRATGVDCVHVATHTPTHYSARHIISAAGALATPHLLLASGLGQHHGSGTMIGRMLMRHANAVVFGIFPGRLDPAREFHKEIGINDFYFGHPSIARPSGNLGSIQQLHCPPVGLVRSGLPRPFGSAGSKMLGHMTGLIVIAGDQPQAENRVEVMQATNHLGGPRAHVHHLYSARDRAARAALTRAAKSILREAGAALTFSLPVHTFSHAMGTVRMGHDVTHAPLDSDGRLRGVSNILVTDASVLPTSGGVNPSLTIAATALRAGCHLAGVSVGVAGDRLVRIAGRRELLDV
jgi:choline dehydrogenase-like flavoprotein